MIYVMLNALTSEASGKYILQNWGNAHSTADAMGWVDPELLKGYGFDKIDEFFAGSLFFNAVEPELEARMLKKFERIKAGF